MERPKLSSTYEATAERTGFAAFGAILARIGEDKPMSADSWAIFGFAAFCIPGVPLIRHASALAKWRQWREQDQKIECCAACGAAMRARDMHTALDGKLYRSVEHAPTFQVAKP